MHECDLLDLSSVIRTLRKVKPDYIFHLASHVAEPLRMALLLNEASNRFGTKVMAEIGDPLPWTDLNDVGNRQQLTSYLYDKVQCLAQQKT